MIRKGDIVKMSEATKASMMNNSCHEHVIEFGDCEGVVEDRMFPNLTAKQAPEVNVRWFPSMLRYGYDPSELVLVKTIRDIRKEKLNKLNELGDKV